MANILIVEDQRSDADNMVKLLEELGESQVEVVDEAAKAVSFLEQTLTGKGKRQLRAVILDLNLPMSSGFEVLRFYHSHPELHAVPVMVWSVLDQQTERKIAELLGARAFVAKSAGPQLIKKTLSSILAGSTTAKSAKSLK